MAKPTSLSILLTFTVGFLLRYILLKSNPISRALGSRVEISTPLTSWKRAVEGVHLWKKGINPYDSDIFHESPLGLLFYNYIITTSAEWIPIIFAICDLLTAAILALASKIYLRNLVRKEGNPSLFPESASKFLLTATDSECVPFHIAAVYLLCPYSILSCGGKSTVTFQNMVLATCILCTIAGQWFFATIILSLLSCHSFYHVALLVPLLMYTYQRNGNEIASASIVVTFAASIAGWIFLFHKVTGSWHFLWSTYGSILFAPDLSPNIGLFWYFFTEMFEHFRVFFLCTFQLNVFIYTAPLAIRLRKEPIFLLFIHLIIITIFKSYPCIGDVAFYLALLPFWSHLFYFMRQRFIVACICASCTLLAPTLWHLWIYSGSANANFFFAITLVFNTGQVFLLTDILSAYIKREYYLENGVLRSEDGTLAPLRLQ